MDTSKNYIDMCSKAQEIQNNMIPNFKDHLEGKSKLKDGDFIFTEEFGVNVIADSPASAYIIKDCFEITDDESGEWDGMNVEVENIFWLPKQDQLQKLIDGTFSIEKLSPQRIGKIVYSGNISDGISFDQSDSVIWKESFLGESLEIVFLKIVMFTKFKKYWDDDLLDWVKS